MRRGEIAAAGGGQSGASGEGGTAGGGGGISGQVPSEVGSTESGGTPASGGGSETSALGGPGGGSPGATGPKFPAPEGMPDGRDDDVVARQLREAAETEKDPELRTRLWEEYRKYKSRKS